MTVDQTAPEPFRHPGVPLLLLAMVLVGCSAYKLGSTPHPPFDSIHVAPVVNRTTVTDLQAVVTDSIRERIAETVPGLRLATQAAQADATLETTLIHYRQRGNIRSSTDTFQAESFILEIQASVSLTLDSGVVLFSDRVVNAEHEVFDIGNFDLARLQAKPVIARELARKIVHAATAVW